MRTLTSLFLSLLTILFILIHTFAPAAYASPGDTRAREESREDEAAVSPKSGWGDFKVVEEREPDSWWLKALLWLPNRALDLIDVFRVDVGVGPSFGAVARITKGGQIGYREMSPASVRIGDFGRTLPIMVERSNEFGVGPGYVRSHDRKVCPGEVGLGLDIFVVGGYAGVCVDELVDFLGGIVFLDPKKDDIR